MATKLKNLKIRKVDFVDEGANPDAHIGMLKRKGQGEGTEEAPQPDSGKGNGVLHKLFAFIGKAAGMGPEEINSAVEEIQKGEAVSFGEKINEISNRKIADEIWDICYALQSALCSVLYDEGTDGASAAAAMQESLDEFYEVVKGSIPNWSSGKEASIVRKNGEVSETDLKIMKSAVCRLTESIEKAGQIQEPGGKEEPANGKGQEGDGKEMGIKIDKSKMTDAERAFYESIEKRYGTEEPDDAGSGGAEGAPIPDPAVPAQAGQVPAAEPPVTKSVVQPVAAVAPAQQAGVESIYSGLHPAVAAELEGLKKFREAVEERELSGIAKKYAIIGKKEEELVPLFKSLKATGGTAYHDMIAVLDQAVETVEKSGAFSEIGKSGHGPSTGAAEAKAEAIAKGYMEKDASLDYASAMAKAWEDNPELMDEYEEEAGF